MSQMDGILSDMCVCGWLHIVQYNETGVPHALNKSTIQTTREASLFTCVFCSSTQVGPAMTGQNYLPFDRSS